jgi:hypothetical protein
VPRKVNKETENKIIDLIKGGKSFCQINSETGHTYKVISRVATEAEIYDLMRENNARYKKEVSSRKTATILKQRAEERYRKTDEEHGELIKQMILAGDHMTPILEETNLKLTYFRRYIRWKSPELTNRLLSNSARVNKENRLKAGIKGAEKTKGIPKKQITRDIKEIYCQMLLDGLHLAEIKRRLLPLGFGSEKVKQLGNLYGKPQRANQSGKNNPMYGKQPPAGTGIGVKGWLNILGKRLFFRSSLEMKIFLHLASKGVVFSLSKHRIPYLLGGKERTYCPDYVIGDKVYEIKPRALLETKENKTKFSAAKEYCEKRNLSFGVVTEKTFDLTQYTEQDIMNLIDENVLEIDNKNLNKLKRWL